MKISVVSVGDSVTGPTRSTGLLLAVVNEVNAECQKVGV